MLKKSVVGEWRGSLGEKSQRHKVVVRPVSYLILRSVPSNVISCSTRRRTSLISLCSSMTLILLFNDTLCDTHKHSLGSESREGLPFKYLLDASSHTFADILPAHIEDPPTEC